MTATTRFLHAICAAACGAMLCGCFPSGRGAFNEEKEPHFLNGRSLVNAMDYQGAIKAFGEALVVNPHSASAHFELGWLYADKASDPAAAIYHYQRYLQLRPKAENAETVSQHIFRLKQELAKAVLPMPSSPGIQRDFEQLAQENRALREEVEQLRAAFASRQAVTSLPSNQETGLPQTRNVGSATATQPLPGQSQTLARGRSIPNPASSLRTHTVRAGETPSSIARKYQVKVNALLSANPSLNPHRMQVGQTLNVPSS